jgi:hypothetical protein
MWYRTFTRTNILLHIDLIECMDVFDVCDYCGPGFFHKIDCIQSTSISYFLQCCRYGCHFPSDTWNENHIYCNSCIEKNSAKNNNNFQIETPCTRCHKTGCSEVILKYSVKTHGPKIVTAQHPVPADIQDEKQTVNRASDPISKVILASFEELTRIQAVSNRNSARLSRRLVLADTISKLREAKRKLDGKDYHGDNRLRLKFIELICKLKVLKKSRETELLLLSDDSDFNK